MTDELDENEIHPRRMLGRYELIAELARGGMGTVYIARLAGVGGFERLLVVKLLHDHLADDELFITMLLDEARTAANVQHQHVVPIVDVAESSVGYYVVMPYIEGYPLNRLLSSDALSDLARIRIGMRVIADVAQGLHAAHTATDGRGVPLDIVHRDVSPQNILVGFDGSARILDFGIALAASRSSASRPGMFKGKPAYMAPEQARGEPCDARADVFALGIVLWELLTRRRLFLGETDLGTVTKVLKEPIDRPSKYLPFEIPRLDDIVVRALERDPDDRPPDARTFGIELEAIGKTADSIATAAEVATRMEDLFADTIGQRRAALRLHLARSAGEERNVLPGELGVIPRLYQRASIAQSSELSFGGTPRSSRALFGHAPERAPASVETALPHVARGARIVAPVVFGSLLGLVALAYLVTSAPSEVSGPSAAPESSAPHVVSAAPLEEPVRPSAAAPTSPAGELLRAPPAMTHVIDEGEPSSRSARESSDVDAVPLARPSRAARRRRSLARRDAKVPARAGSSAGTERAPDFESNPYRMR